MENKNTNRKAEKPMSAIVSTKDIKVFITADRISVRKVRK